MIATDAPDAATRTPTPTSLVLHRRSRMLEVSFTDGATFRLPFELMRVYSPSAEVQGHGAGQSVLQLGKEDVDIVALDPVGHYAVLPRFSDGHVSGIFSWDYLYFLGREEPRLWSQYRARVAAAGQEPMAQAGCGDPGHTHLAGQACASHRPSR